MSQRWRAVGNTVSDLTSPRFVWPAQDLNLKSAAPETYTLPLYQLVRQPQPLKTLFRSHLVTNFSLHGLQITKIFEVGLVSGN